MGILIRDTLKASAQMAARVVRKIILSEEKPVLGLATGGTPLRMYQELIRMKQTGKLSFKTARLSISMNMQACLRKTNALTIIT